MRTRAALAAVAIIVAATIVVAADPPASRRATSAATPGGIHGFHHDSLPGEHALEALLQSLPEEARVDAHARFLTEEPHVSGTPENEAVARYIYDRFREAGLETEMKTYDVYLGYVRDALLEQVEPEPARLNRPETGDPADKDAADPRAALAWNAYSPSADLTREVVYANYARAEDFETLERLGVPVRNRLVLARYFNGYRGGKLMEAEKHGAAGVIFYSDPMEDGYFRGEVYPRGPWGPEGHVQRGAAVYDFLVPGDPLTPGWASVDGAKRIPASQSVILPRIPCLPISGRDALIVLKNLAGPAVPHGWQGGLPLTYHLGPGPSRLHLRVDASFETRPITDVIGVLRGTAEPDSLVLLGNHHDAWVHGAVDPSSGTATMLELARVAGELARRGHRPKRTLVFGNWDAEEWTLTGSTEWGEENADRLVKNGVSCLNVDSSSAGSQFQASVVPTLRRLVDEALRDVRDPNSGSDLYAATVRNAATHDDAPDRVGYDILGSGSDYTVFFNHLGMPSLDAGFDGPYGVYHSVLDDYFWMTHFGDPGFKYHTAMVRVWGLLAYRLANADILPFEESPYPAEVAKYLDAIEREASAPRRRGQAGGRPALPDLVNLRAALAAWTETAAALDRAIDASLSGAPPAPDTTARVNAALVRAERDLLSPDGLPDRPWFRHLIYAPLPTYAAETLPGLREAVNAGRAARARTQADLLTAALHARTATLNRAVQALTTGGEAAGAAAAGAAKRSER